MTNLVHDDTGVAWRPTADIIERAQLTRFLRFCQIESFADLHRRSIENPGWFTDRLLRFLDVRFDRPYDSILDLSRGIEWPRWCIGGQLNITKSCVDRWAEAAASADAAALIWEGEEGSIQTLTYAGLRDRVASCAAGLRACGLRKGDAIGLHLPMLVETVIALLAIGRIGGIAVPLFSGYGSGAIESRLGDVGARALFTCDSFPRRGRSVPAKSAVDKAAEQLPALELVVVVQRSAEDVPMTPGRDVSFQALLQMGTSRPELGVPEPTDAEDPLLVLYTSGTTGRPKGILHSHCGFPVKAAQDMCFGTDVGRGTRIAWVTDIGWMMGPWLIYGGLILGGTVVLYDGAPDFPGPDRLWSFAARHRVEVLGVSPTLVRALSTHGPEWPRRHDLSSLRILGSTGEPWNPDPWSWLFETVGRGVVPIINYSGGTEISGGILMGNPLLPIKPCGFPAPCPGIAADVVDEQGRSLRNEVGELAIRRPWIGQARGFWRDEARYLDTYWSRVPGLWIHGDWARVDADGHWFILGRSDDTLKIAGKRVGPAEVESVLVAHPAVTEAAAIGVPDKLKGGALVAFCVLLEGAEPSTALELELKGRVANELGRPLKPERILFVDALPKTRNAKIMRRVIRAAYLGEDPGDLTALDNPSALGALRSSRTARGALPQHETDG